MNTLASAAPLEIAAPVLPFTCTLDDGRTLVCNALLRHLRGKRLVCAATLDGQPAVAKIYVDPARARTRAARNPRCACAVGTRHSRSDAVGRQCLG